jgi:hypothetical protein
MRRAIWYIIGFVAWILVGFMLGQGLGQELPTPPVEVVWLQPNGPPVLTDEIYGMPVRSPWVAELDVPYGSETGWLVMYANPQSAVWVGPRRRFSKFEQPTIVRIAHPQRPPYFDPLPWPTVQGPPEDRGLELLCEYQRLVGSWVGLAEAMRCPLNRWEE